jgi:hypothetical protein
MQDGHGFEGMSERDRHPEAGSDRKPIRLRKISRHFIGPRHSGSQRLEIRDIGVAALACENET